MPDDVYRLPDLAYDYGALEPHISGQIMELHHDKHHAGYVQGANTALEKLADACFGVVWHLAVDGCAARPGRRTGIPIFWLVDLLRISAG